MKCSAKVFLPILQKISQDSKDMKQSLKFPCAENLKFCAIRSCSPISQNLSHHAQYNDSALLLAESFPSCISCMFVSILPTFHFAIHYYSVFVLFLLLY